MDWPLEIDRSNQVSLELGFMPCVCNAIQASICTCEMTNQAERQSKEIESFQGWGLSASFNAMAGFSPTTVTQICGVGAWSRHFRSRDVSSPLSSFIGRPEASRDHPCSTLSGCSCPYRGKPAMVARPSIPVVAE